MDKLLADMGGKFKFSAQESDLAPFDGNGTKVKIPSEIKQPLDFEPKISRVNVELIKAYNFYFLSKRSLLSLCKFRQFMKNP